MTLQDITLEQLQRVAADFGSAAYDEPAVPKSDAKALEYILRQVSLAIPMQSLEASSDVIGAIAFGVQIGLKLAR